MPNNTDIVPLNIIQSWFETGDYPTQEQFQKSWASLWHKSDKLPITSVENLELTLQKKVDKSVYEITVDNLAKKDASNIVAQEWKNKLNIPSLPENMATIDDVPNGVLGNVFTKDYIEENYMPVFVDQEKRTINSESNLSDTVMHDAVITGWNVLPNYVGKQEYEDGNPANIYSSGYIVHGVDVLTDFKGNTDYRPWHPAHDAWVAYGYKVAKGVWDGTNGTLFGTALFENNDVRVWDSVTAFGKGIHNAKFPFNDPNRTAFASNGLNLRSMMNNVVTFGNENWCGDIYSSAIFGANTRNYRYIFNSIVLGINNTEASKLLYPDETHDVVLDSDIFIGNGMFKDPKRHPATHNIFIGNNYWYGTGSPNLKYRPLIEANTLLKYWGINGVLRNLITDELNKVPTEMVELSLISSPANSNSSYNTSTERLGLNNSPSGAYRVAENLVVGESYLFTILSNIGNTGTWGYKIGSLVDSGNNDDWLGNNNSLVEITDPAQNYFEIILDGNVSGNITVKLLHIKKEENQVPVQEVRDYNNNVTLEIRTGNVSDNHVSIGKNSAPKFASGKNNFITGNDNLVKAHSIMTSFIYGSSNLQNVKSSRLNSVFGFENFKNSAIADMVVAFGQYIAPNAQNIKSAVIIGRNALTAFKGTYIDPNLWNELVVLGNGAGLGVEEARKSVIVGDATGQTKNVFQGTLIGNRARFKDTDTSNNETVFGADAVGNGDNTVTFGNTAVQSVHLSDFIKVDRNSGLTGSIVYPLIGVNSFVQKKHLDDSKPYKVYSGLLKFTGSPAQPDFIVFENTVGNITWSRTGVGEFQGILNGAFSASKVWSQSVINQTDGSLQKMCISGRIDNNTIYVKIITTDGTPADVIGEVGSFEFRIYN